MSSLREAEAPAEAATSPEAAPYWHALTTSGNAPRGLRALRAFLADG